MKNNIFIVDANFILSYLLADIPNQYQVATEFFHQVRSNKAKAIIKESVLTEVVLILSHHYKVSRDRVVKVLTNFLRYKGIRIDDKETMIEALNIYEHTNLHIVEAIIAANTKLSGQSLQAFNPQLQKYVQEH